ncbi:hypothetical protein GOODEAATRI_020721 [Goodea atripinnis]|uniref:Uncharacterized protein n=1 Tax=Goodea atripinnis TaxID=208336 RepID=A0ABV0N6C4_9TELE
MGILECRSAERAIEEVELDILVQKRCQEGKSGLGTWKEQPYAVERTCAVITCSGLASFMETMQLGAVPDAVLVEVGMDCLVL